MSDIPATDFDLLAADISRQPELWASSLPALRQAVTGLLPALPPAPGRVYLVGCGDSLCAGQAVRHTWERLLGCAVEAVPAMEFSRYLCETAPAGAWVVALSLSGAVVRVQEAVRCASQHGLFTLAITGKPDSGLVKQGADAVLLSGYRRLGFVPGTSSYTFNLALFLELGAALAKDARTAQTLRTELDAMPELLEQAVARAMAGLASFAALLDAVQPLYVLASGPNFASAHYATLKFDEICQTLAVACETEEYAHDVFYQMDWRTPVLLLAAPDRGFSRSLEVAHWLHRRGMPLCIITGEAQAAEFTGLSQHILALPNCARELIPALYAVPVQALAYLLGRRLGASFYHSRDAGHYLDGDAQIYESKLDAE